MISGLKNMDYRKLRNLICGCGACIIFAATPLSAKIDTVRTGKVIVTDTKIKYSDAQKYVASKNIDRSIIDQKGSETLNEALNSVPGIFIKDYGGLGGLKTISVRGTSSNQTAVMIDGIKLNSSQNGSVDLGILSTDIANQIEVIRGGASALYGGNAIGGAINVITDNNPQENISLSASHGAFGTWRYAGNYADTYKSLFWNINSEYSKSEGDYPFTMQIFGHEKDFYRENGQSESYTGNFVLGTSTESYTLSMRNIITYNDRGAPGAVFFNKLSTPALLNSKDIYTFLNFNKVLNENIIYSIKAFTKFGELNYKEKSRPGLNTFDTDNTYFNRNVLVKSNFSCLYSFGVFDFETLFEYNELRGQMLQEAAGTKAERGNFAISSSYFGTTELTKYQKLNYNAAIRYDYLDEESTVSPMIGLSYETEAIPLDIKASYSYNFRPPSFNEMYYMNYGNLSLVPERSHSYNIGFASDIFDNLDLEANLFFINTRDQIVSVPRTTMSWTAQNLGKVHTKGIELNATYLPLDWIKLDFAYTMQNAIDKTPKENNSYNENKKLVYSPDEMLNLLVAIEKYKTLFIIESEYISHRYTTAENTPDNTLDPYILVHAGLKYTFEADKNTISLRLDIKNILDNKDYKIIKNYPMPGRYWNLKISYDWR